MAPARCPDTPSRRGSGSPSTLAHPVGPYLSLEPRSSCGKGVHGDVLVHMDSLSVLSEIVEARETPGAVTLEWTFTGVFPDPKS